MDDGKGKEGYGLIFKTTFLFGFVQVFNILVKVGLNKVVALLLGANGMGIIGLYHTATNMLKTGAGLGVNQSAVRDISEANSCNDERRFSFIILLTNRILLITSLLGVVLTIILAPVLSKWQFGDLSKSIQFVWLSLVVGFTILSDGQLAILKGMRRLRDLALSSVLGSFVGLLSAIPFYMLFGEGGIVPSLIISAFAALFFSNYYVRKINYRRFKIPVKQLFKEASPMLKMGIALMLVTFIGSVFDLVVASFISRSGSLADVGYYNAGTTIVSSYFGIIITAMSTDYYPRISAVHNDNNKLAEEMNRQSETGLIMVFPLVVLFIFLSPLFIRILYSAEFNATNAYTDYAMLGTIIIIVSNCMGMILLAKQASNIFIFSVIIQRLLLIGIYLFSYSRLGLMGLGISYIMTGVVHIVFMVFILNRFYKIRLNRDVVSLLLTVLFVTIVTVFIRKIEIAVLKYCLGSFVFLLSTLYSYFYVKNNMGLDILSYVMNRIRIKHD